VGWDWQFYLEVQGVLLAIVLVYCAIRAAFDYFGVWPWERLFF
jgi:hypothetical protein